MTPKISLLTAIVGASLVLGVPVAWGAQPVAQSPDAVERAVLAREQSQRLGLETAAPDAFERAVVSQRAARDAASLDAHGRVVPIGDAPGSAQSPLPDAFERAITAEKRPAVTGHYRDAFERADQTGGVSIVADSHDRVTPVATPTGSPVATGRDIEWPQIGIGFALGLLLALALGMALRLAQIRPLAH